MKVLMVVWIPKLLFDHGHNGAMIEPRYSVIFGARMSCTLRKRNTNSDWRLYPAWFFIFPFPFYFCVTSCRASYSRSRVNKSGVYLGPFCILYVSSVEAWISDNINKIFEALLWFLNTVTPIPIPQKKRTSVWIGVEVLHASWRGWSDWFTEWGSKFEWCKNRRFYQIT